MLLIKNVWKFHFTLNHLSFRWVTTHCKQLRSKETKKILWYFQTSSIHDCFWEEQFCYMVKTLHRHYSFALIIKLFSALSEWVMMAAVAVAAAAVAVAAAVVAAVVVIVMMMMMMAIMMTAIYICAWGNESQQTQHFMNILYIDCILLGYFY